VIVLVASFSTIVNALGVRLSSSQIRVSFETVLGFREDLLHVRFRCIVVGIYNYSFLASSNTLLIVCWEDFLGYV
jgi:hypothetical protein